MNWFYRNFNFFRWNLRNSRPRAEPPNVLESVPDETHYRGEYQVDDDIDSATGYMVLRKQNPFFIYTKHLREQKRKGVHLGIRFKRGKMFLRAAGAKWRHLTEEQKRPFREMANTAVPYMRRVRMQPVGMEEEKVDRRSTLRSAIHARPATQCPQAPIDDKPKVEPIVWKNEDA